LKAGTIITPIVLIFLFIFIAGSASQPSAGASDDKIKIFVSILPQIDFVKKIGGDRVEVEAMVLPGQSPHTYEPSIAQMTKLSKASVYFIIGVPFENAFLPKKLYASKLIFLK